MTWEREEPGGGSDEKAQSRLGLINSFANRGWAAD